MPNISMEELQASNNEFLNCLKIDDFYCRPQDKDESNIEQVYKDVLRNLLINGQNLSGFEKYDDWWDRLVQSFGEGFEEETIKEACRFYTQSLLSGFFLAISTSVKREYLVKKDYKSDLYKKGDEIYFTTQLYDMSVYHMDQDWEVKIPGSVISTYRLTEKGYVLEEVIVTNSLLKELCLGDHDVTITPAKLRQAYEEEYQQAEEELQRIFSDPHSSDEIISGGRRILGDLNDSDNDFDMSLKAIILNITLKAIIHPEMYQGEALSVWAYDQAIERLNKEYESLTSLLRHLNALKEREISIKEKLKTTYDPLIDFYRNLIEAVDRAILNGSLKEFRYQLDNLTELIPGDQKAEFSDWVQKQGNRTSLSKKGKKYMSVLKEGVEQKILHFVNEKEGLVKRLPSDELLREELLAYAVAQIYEVEKGRMVLNRIRKELKPVPPLGSTAAILTQAEWQKPDEGVEERQVEKELPKGSGEEMQIPKKPEEHIPPEQEKAREVKVKV